MRTRATSRAQLQATTPTSARPTSHETDTKSDVTQHQVWQQLISHIDHMRWELEVFTQVSGDCLSGLLRDVEKIQTCINKIANEKQ